MKLNAKHVVIGAGLLLLFMWGRKAFAQSAQAGAKDVTRGGALAASPINSSRVAAKESSGKSDPLPLRRLALPAGASSFTNPQNYLSDYKYASTAQSAGDAPVRPDYAYSGRGVPVLKAPRQIQ